MLEIAGFAGAVLMGVTLGLIGAGGSILTVPLLVYLMDVPPVAATGYSLFVVGLTAMVGSVTFMRRGLVDYRTAVLFSVPAFSGVYTARAFIIPSVPGTILQAGGIVVSKNLLIMVLFAVLMVIASVSMIRKETGNAPANGGKPHHVTILIEGFVVGVLTGLVGAGGGFLIIPALVLLARLPMKTAVGTSLLIIAVKSLLGFTGDIGHLEIDWSLLMKFSAFAVIGIFIGSFLSRYVPGSKLRPAFGWFVAAMGIYIIVREILGART